MNTLSEIRNIAVEAQIADHNLSGGVATHLAALVKALGELDGPESYSIVCAPENPDWLEPYLGLNQRLVIGPRRRGRQLVKRVFGDQWTKVWSWGYRSFSRAFSRISPRQAVEGLRGDMHGFYEKLSAKLVHVFYQTYVRTNLPVIFNPHDLQHEHFPQFFDPVFLARRKHVYREACLKAEAVVAGSQYTKKDVIQQYGVAPKKVWVIPLAPAISICPGFSIEDCQTILRKYKVDRPFMYYPAATWEHKNHLRLLEAVRNLRKQGLQVNLVCTGAMLEPIWAKLREYINDNNLGDSVKFLGLISGEEVRAIYRMCQFVIAPSLFEQASGPMLEAWREGAAVTASNVTSLPEQAGNAALLFDPYSISAIERSVVRMWQDKTLRLELQQLGKLRLKNYSWERTAKAYRALYRHLGGWLMTDEDRFLLGWDWIGNPRGELQIDE